MKQHRVFLRIREAYKLTTLATESREKHICEEFTRSVDEFMFEHRERIFRAIRQVHPFIRFVIELALELDIRILSENQIRFGFQR